MKKQNTIISFNRYDLKQVLEDQSRIEALMQSAHSYAKKTKSKTLTIDTPKKRRGNQEIRTIRHYDLNSLIEHFKKQVKKNDVRFIKKWKVALRDFNNLKLYLQREQVIAVLLEQFTQEEEWLRQFSYVALKELLDGLLFKEKKKD